MKFHLGMILFILLVSAGRLAADHIPVAPSPPFVLEPVGRVIASAGRFNPYLEILGRWNDPAPGFGYRSLTAGSYFRVIRNLKVGAFYRLQAGARHDDDWVESGVASPGWIWQDTNGRYESLVILDASPRFLLPFLGRTSVFMLKTRWQYNLFNNHQSLMVRPGITYFFVRDRTPVAEIGLQYAAYLSLNFGETLLYAYAPYLELLYHLTPELQLSLGASAQTHIWSTSESVLSATGAHYTLKVPSFRLTAGMIYRPSF